MKIVVHTLGCKVNQYESDALITMFKQKGFEVSTKLERADYYIINTCAVTNEAERKSRQLIAKCLELNSNAKIIVCGCASQNNSLQFHNNNITYITGVADKVALVDNIDNNLTQIFELPTTFEENMPVLEAFKTRAYVKIQDGCNNFCSYCLIPYLRGRSRSRNIVNILKEVENFSKQTKEIVLTGIDISDYKIDGKLALDKLLLFLDAYNLRLRIGSLEVRVITPKFISQIKKCKNLCPHFHLSLQSGCDSVLKAMNRHYKTKEYELAVKRLKKDFPNCAITTDVIVGFPTETQENFKTTCEFIKKIGFSNIHIFPYSKRNGTVATKLYKDLSGETKKARVKVLTEIKKQLAKEYIEQNIGKEVQILIEEEKNGYCRGYSQNYINCYLTSSVKPNQIVSAIIQKAFKDGALVKLKEN